MPSLLDFDIFCESLEQITTTKILTKGKFHSDGLFSEQIFGPLKNYTCQCGIYHGKSHNGSKCNICNVDIVHSTERRRRFAKIILPIPVVNPIFYNLVAMVGGSNIKNAIDNLMRNEKSVLYKDGDEFIVTDQENLESNIPTWDKLEAIQKLVFEYAEQCQEDESWKLIKDNIDKLFINKVIVLPPDVRPISKSGANNVRVGDQINRYYVQILTKKESMSGTVITINQDKKLFYTYFRQLQKDVNELYDHVLGKMSKKEGLIRGNILGKRIDFSGRAVIAPEPTLNFGECILPYFMILEIYKIQIAKRLIEIGRFKLLNKAIDFVDDCIDTKNNILFGLSKEIVKGEVCLLNRQPSLHRLGMLGFNIQVGLDSVIKVHPMVTGPFGADFDGDQMAVYIPISEKAKQEIIDKIFVSKNLYSPADGSLSTVPSQDIILGIYILSTNCFPELKSEIEYKGSKISLASKEINNCFPNDYKLITGLIRKKELVTILNEIKDLYDEEITTKVLDNIKRIGFKYATLFGTTMTLEDCMIEGSEEIRDSIYESENISEQLQNSSDLSITDILRDKFKYSYLIDSGTRGSWTQIKQLILTRGFVSNFEGEILPSPIKNSLIHGLTEKEFFNSTYGCRKGLLDVALNTGISGYLSRKLIFACANLQISLDVDDCGTQDLLEIFIKDEKKARSLIGRYYKKDEELKLITTNNFQEIINKTISVRSPIFCKNERICHKCYGDTFEKLHTRFVGIIAAQTLGEKSTQLVLRTFHESGSAKSKQSENESTEPEDMKQDDIIADLATASRILHKFKNKNIKEIIEQLYEVYGGNSNILHVHFECVLSQLIWNGNKKWRLLENRNMVEKEFFSVQTVPSKESWVLGLAFSNPKKHTLRGILYPGNYKGLFDKILSGKGIE